MDEENHFVHKSSIVDQPVKIGEGTKIWHFCHIMKGTKIGKNCNLGQNVFIGSDASIGNNVKIQNNVSVYDGVTLEDYVFCGPSMVFTNDPIPRSKYPKEPNKFLPTLVKEGASIGANATVICGNTIGKHAFIGSGSVITNDIPDYALAYGNPARIHGWMCECGKKLMFKNGNATCQLCNSKYSKKGDEVKKEK